MEKITWSKPGTILLYLVCILPRHYLAKKEAAIWTLWNSIITKAQLWYKACAIPRIQWWVLRLKSITLKQWESSWYQTNNSLNCIFTNSQHTRKTQGGTVFPNLTLEILWSMSNVQVFWITVPSHFPAASSLLWSQKLEPLARWENEVAPSHARPSSSLGLSLLSFNRFFLQTFWKMLRLGDAYQNLRFFEYYYNKLNILYFNHNVSDYQNHNTSKFCTNQSK